MESNNCLSTLLFSNSDFVFYKYVCLLVIRMCTHKRACTRACAHTHTHTHTHAHAHTHTHTHTHANTHTPTHTSTSKRLEDNTYTGRAVNEEHTAPGNQPLLLPSPPARTHSHDDPPSTQTLTTTKPVTHSRKKHSVEPPAFLSARRKGGTQHRGRELS